VGQITKSIGKQQNAELQQQCAAGVRTVESNNRRGGNKLFKNGTDGESRVQRMWHTKGDGVATVRGQLTLCAVS
jgi:hypothetical protein